MAVSSKHDLDKPKLNELTEKAEVTSPFGTEYVCVTSAARCSLSQTFLRPLFPQLILVIGLQGYGLKGTWGWGTCGRGCVAMVEHRASGTGASGDIGLGGLRRRCGWHWRNIGLREHKVDL